MYTDKKRTYLDIPKELFEEIFNKSGKNKKTEVLRFRQFGQEFLDFETAEISIPRAKNKPMIGLSIKEDRVIFSFWYKDEGKDKFAYCEEQFMLVARSIPLTEEQISSGEKIRYEIKFFTSTFGVDPAHMSADIASDILKKAHEMLKNTKNYYRVIK
jgi:hypothetical protein